MTITVLLDLKIAFIGYIIDDVCFYRTILERKNFSNDYFSISLFWAFLKSTLVFFPTMHMVIGIQKLSHHHPHHPSSSHIFQPRGHQRSYMISTQKFHL